MTSSMPMMPQPPTPEPMGNPPNDRRTKVMSRAQLRRAILSAKTKKGRAACYQRAQEMGMLGVIPDSWKPDGSLRS